ncbi:riboflavin synthase [Helicobacter winghamensis]|uniref:riboflavin synthase n=1 Tax=Helicobacter winghamensis TaxID=157268 RepID=UPI0001A293E7|nr:riboflavin synthase [Helicobacter winghamensis]EEO25775.1 riboflavin synthase, alpha subunit [Helicobacter winghamensis ATCC BAA-430]PKT79364.1 riboflavin synthase subunit alpha [Helicobacter winghamensis]PKT79578.1 riboflavin synthase subunit alpha [Helicobacter winghamensis]
MFTGLVREFGRVESLQGSSLRILAKHKPNIGDSIAVNGACLTAIEVFNGGFVLELSEETQKHIALESYQDLVHIEPAMRLSDRLDGHIVQGHIDGIGTITKITPHSIGTDFFVKVDSKVLALCVPKGSIAINGISLTINEVLDSILRLTIIPHTLQTTLFKNYKAGERVNIETDCLARMVQHFLAYKQDSKLSWEAVDRILGSY